MKKSPTQAGFTLVELLVTSFLTGLFILALINLEQLLAGNRDTLSINTQTYNEATISVERIVRELRDAEQAADGTFPIELADDQEIIFYTNLDADLFPEKVRYFIDNDQLKRGLTQPVGNPAVYDPNTEQITLIIPHVTNLSNPIFRYYNGDWPTDTVNNPLPAPARLTDTKLVTVSITINPDPSQPTSDYYLESSTQIRALKTNL